MHSTRFVLGLALLLIALPTARAADDDVVTRLYDVGALLQADSPPDVQILGLPPSGLALRPTEDDEEEPTAFLVAEALLELVHSAVPGGWDEDERTLLSVEGRRLMVRAAPAAHDGVAELLAKLWTEAMRRVSIEGIRLVYGAAERARLAEGDLLAALRSGRIDAKTRDALVQAAGSSSVASTVVRAGSPGTLGRVRATSYVRSYDVEIAQDSVVGNPQVDTVVTGWFVGVTAHRLQAGGILLDAQVQTADLEEPLRRQALEAEPFGSVDLPSCRVLRFVTAARVQPGQSVVLSAAPEGDHGPLEVVILTPTPRGERGLRQDLRRWDVSGLTAMQQRWRMTTAASELRGAVRAGALNPPRIVRLEAADPVVVVDDLVEAITSSLGDEAWEREGVWLAPWGRALLARNDPTVLATIDRHVTEREHTLASESAMFRLMALEGDHSETLAAATLALPHGRNVVWQGGVERAYVADWDVEVAQEARTGDPMIGTVFGGLAFEARLDPAPVSDHFALTLALVWSQLDPRMETRRLHNECTGVVDIPRLARLDLQTDLVARRGETQRIDAGTLEDGRRLVVELTLGR